MNAKTENQDTGADFVAAAERIGETIDGSEERGEILMLAATLYADAGQDDLAASLAQTIDDSYHRELALTRIAVSRAAAGEGDQAESLLEMLEDDAAYGLAIEQIAAAYARNGEIDKAIEITQRLSDNASALSGIALACPSAAHLMDCIEVARAIDYPELKTKTLTELAGKARQLEALAEAAELIEEAAAAAAAIDFPEQRIEAWLAIASWYKDNPQSEAGAEALNQAHRDCTELGVHARDVARKEIAIAHAERREFGRAEQLLGDIDDPFEFSDGASAVAFEHYQSGNQAAAIGLLADGLEVAGEEPVYSQEALIRRDAIRGNLAQTYAAIGRVEDALRVSELLDSAEQQDLVLREIALTLASNDGPNSVFGVLEKIGDNAKRVLWQVEFARVWMNKDRLPLADRMLSNASAEVAALERPYQRTICLAELAQAYELREQPGHASEILFEALKTAATIEGTYHQARALLSLAGKHRELNRPAGEPELQILDEITARLD